MNEFEMIARYFAPLSPDGLKNDAAVLKIPEGQELVVTSDTLNAGTHFLEDMAPGDIARKALRVNLSDLAAMGADPYAYQLNIVFPEKPEEAWLEGFTGALAEDQDRFHIFCSGGDTTTIRGPLSISITALGLVPEGRALTRSGAKPGDHILLSGPVGDALLGLRILKGELEGGAPELKKAYICPQPRVDVVKNLRTYAHAAIDVSDGLVADLRHVAKRSGLSAVLDLRKITFSKYAQAYIDNGVVSYADLLSGGDDYVLIAAVPPEATSHFPGFQVIGHFEEGEPSIRIEGKGAGNIDFEREGWTHF